jgi:hypothetical protein
MHRCSLSKDGSAVANRSRRQQPRGRFRFEAILATTCGMLIVEAPHAQGEETAVPQTAATANSSMDDHIDAAEADRDGPRRKLVGWNRYEGPYFTLRVGLGFGYAYGGYAQDDAPSCSSEPVCGKVSALLCRWRSRSKCSRS